MAEEEKTEQIFKPKPPREPSHQETAATIADQLGEKEEEARAQIVTIVRALGRTQARALLQQTLEIEASGGMMVLDGSRRRTLGGIYFHLAYSTGKPKSGRKLIRPMAKKTDGENPQSEPAIVFRWEDRIAVMREAEEMKGQANVKITVVGRPGKIVDRGQCVVTMMESNKVPALPKGLPTPPAGATKYTVYIGSKQWKKVAEAIKNPEDVLIVEGFPTIDVPFGSIAVFATNTTTKLLQMAQKEAQKTKSETAAS